MRLMLTVYAKLFLYDPLLGNDISFIINDKKYVINGRFRIPIV